MALNLVRGQSKTDSCFNTAFLEIDSMLSGSKELSFKRASYLTENAYLNGKLNYEAHCSLIDSYKKLALAFAKANHLNNYKYADSSSVLLSASLFKVFTDTIFDEKRNILSLPFRYDFENIASDNSVALGFVSRLLLTKTGNCHSLPYLYKILARELSTDAWLAFAPMHIYIKERNQKAGWYNVELTSGQYPVDAYLMAAGYISRDNIVKGVYMDTLSLKESIAVCLMDLCYAYMEKAKENADPGFILKCANRTLEVKPDYVNALLRLSSVHKQLEARYRLQNNIALAGEHRQKMIEARKKLMDLDYRDIPGETFNKWFSSYQKNKSKYNNPEINTNFKTVKK